MESTWKELCWKFASLVKPSESWWCPPEKDGCIARVQTSYANYKGKWHAKLFIKDWCSGQWNQKGKYGCGRTEEEAYEDLFNFIGDRLSQVDVNSAYVEAFRQINKVKLPKFGSKEELLLKLEVM